VQRRKPVIHPRLIDYAHSRGRRRHTTDAHRRCTSTRRCSWSDQNNSFPRAGLEADGELTISIIVRGVARVAERPSPTPLQTPAEISQRTLGRRVVLSEHMGQISATGTRPPAAATTPGASRLTRTAHGVAVTPPPRDGAPANGRGRRDDRASGEAIQVH